MHHSNTLKPMSSLCLIKGNKILSEIDRIICVNEYEIPK